MEAGHVSSYFTRRTGRKKRKFPKLWAVVAAASHVCLGMIPGTGPTPDDPQFHRVAAQAHARARAVPSAGGRLRLRRRGAPRVPARQARRPRHHPARTRTPAHQVRHEPTRRLLPQFYPSTLAQAALRAALAGRDVFLDAQAAARLVPARDELAQPAPRDVLEVPDAELHADRGRGVGFHRSRSGSLFRKGEQAPSFFQKGGQVSFFSTVAPATKERTGNTGKDFDRDGIGHRGVDFTTSSAAATDRSGLRSGSTSPPSA